MGREPEAKLGVGEIALGLAKLAHDYARERVLEVYHEKLPQRVVGPELFATPLLTLHAVEHRLGVACIRQGALRWPIGRPGGVSGYPRAWYRSVS